MPDHWNVSCLQQQSNSVDDVEQPMKICLFMLLMSIFIGASYASARREAREQPGSAQSGGSLVPQG
jgi:hypothetical protein